MHTALLCDLQRLLPPGPESERTGQRVHDELTRMAAEIDRLQRMIGRPRHRPAAPAEGKTFEVNPPKTSLEQVLCRISIVTTTREPTGATATQELTEAEFSGMLAGMPHRGDRLLRELAELIAWAYLQYRGSLERMGDHLDTWGRQRVLFRQPGLSADGKTHARLAHAVACRHIERIPLDECAHRAKLSKRQWPKWRPWFDELTGRVRQADHELSQHLLTELRSRNVTLAESNEGD